MSLLAYCGGYATGVAVTFVTFTAVWTRKHRPWVYSYSSRVRQWNDAEVWWYGIIQAVLWPVFVTYYLTWGLFKAVNSIGRAYIALIKPKPRPPQVVEQKDQYVVEAEKEVNKLLEDPWEGR